MILSRRAVLLLPLGVAACAATPARFYTLAAVPGAPVETAPLRLELRRIGLAGYLDRPGIVRRADAYRLDVTDEDRWAEPLGTMLARVLTEALVQRLPRVSVFNESGAISTLPDLIAEVDVQRFDADEAGAVVLVAQLALRRDGSRLPASATTLRLVAPSRGVGVAGQVATMSAALGQLADALALLVKG